MKAVRAPRRYETLFKVEKLQVMVAGGQKVEDVIGELVRNIERCRPGQGNSTPVEEVVLAPVSYCRPGTSRPGRFFSDKRTNRD